MREVAGLNDGQQPLRGAVLCCTSVPHEQRTEIADLGNQMGAITKLDLTSDVTHLIVGDTDTEKYRYVAKARQDVKLVLPSWIEAVRQCWMEGGEPNVSELEEEHRCPTFLGLRICVTGFDNIDERNELMRTISSNGAQYNGDLTKTVTHLIAASPQGKKYEYAGAWGLKIVTLEWLVQSLKRRMMLDEAYFHPLTPRDQQGVGAIQPKSPLGKRIRREAGAQADEHGKRKLRRTASTRLESQNDDMWAEMGSAGPANDSFGTESGRMRPAESESKPVNRPVSRLEAEVQRPNSAAPGSVGTGFRTALFDGITVCILGFDAKRRAILTKHLTANGAQIPDMKTFEQQAMRTDETLTESDFGFVVMMPYNLTREEQQSLPSLQGRYSIVSEMWIEKCLHRKTLVDRSLLSCRPLNWHLIEGFDKLKLCPSGFTSIDLMHFEKASRLAGAQCDGQLHLKTSLLVCSQEKSSSEKLTYALRNNIEVVSDDWFWESVEAGVMQPPQHYSLCRTTQLDQPSGSNFFHPDRNPRSSSTVDRNRSSGTDTDPQQRPKPRLLKRTTSRFEGDSGLFEKSNEEDRDKSQPLRELSDTNSQGKKEKVTADEPLSESKSFEAETFQQDSLRRESLDGTSDKNSSNHPTTTTSSKDRNLRSAIAQLLANKRRNNSIEDPNSPDAQQESGSESAAQSRRHRPLGRATSNPRGASLGRNRSALSRTSSMASNGSGAGGGVVREAEESFESRSDFLSTTSRVPAEEQVETESQASFKPSQALGYEDPEALAAREKIMRSHQRGKGKSKGKGTSPGSEVRMKAADVPPTVKDADADQTADGENEDVRRSARKTRNVLKR